MVKELLFCSLEYTLQTYMTKSDSIWCLNIL